MDHPALYECEDFLDEYHTGILERAVQNMLSTNTAELAYAHILDGLPLQSVYIDAFPENPEHPVNALSHTKLCSGSCEKAQEFRKNFALSELQFQGRVMHSPILLLHARCVGVFSRVEITKGRDINESWGLG